MALNTNAAYGLYSQEVALNDVVHTLNQAGFVNEDICMMLSPSHPIASLIKDASLFSSACESNAVTASLIGWLSEFGAVMIPTVGFFIRSQAFFRALMVSRDAPTLCGSASTLTGLGFSDEEAGRFEHRLRRDGVMVYVSCSENSQTAWAREVLRHTGAQETATLDEELRVIGVAATA